MAAAMISLDQPVVRCLVPINVRPLCSSIEDDFGLYISSGIASFKRDGAVDFWSLARQARAQLASAFDAESLQDRLARTLALLAANHDPQSIYEAYRQGVVFDVVVSNLGKFPSSNQTNALRVTALYLLLNTELEPSIAVATAEGRICVSATFNLPVRPRWFENFEQLIRSITTLTGTENLHTLSASKRKTRKLHWTFREVAAAQFLDPCVATIFRPLLFNARGVPSQGPDRARGRHRSPHLHRRLPTHYLRQLANLPHVAVTPKPWPVSIKRLISTRRNDELRLKGSATCGNLVAGTSTMRRSAFYRRRLEAIYLGRRKIVATGRRHHRQNGLTFVKCAYASFAVVMAVSIRASSRPVKSPAAKARLAFDR
jgi:hypothetical protein